MSSSDTPRDFRSVAGNLAIDRRGVLDVVAVLVVVGAYLAAAQSKSFDDVLTPSTRSSLYISLAATTGALLGFALTALAILVALPSTERLEALRKHSKWDRVPQAFLRAARALIVALVLCTLGIALDALIALALVRVVGALVALDHVMAVARNPAPLRKPIDDPGP